MEDIKINDRVVMTSVGLRQLQTRHCLGTVIGILNDGRLTIARDGLKSLKNFAPYLWKKF